MVSIPQAVGTIATYQLRSIRNGRFQVSIPQAVGTIATMAKEKYSSKAEEMMFQYRKR